MAKSDLIERLTKETGKTLHQVTDTVETLFERMKDASNKKTALRFVDFGLLEVAYTENTAAEI